TLTRSRPTSTGCGRRSRKTPPALPSWSPKRAVTRWCHNVGARRADQVRERRLADFGDDRLRPPLLAEVRRLATFAFVVELYQRESTISGITAVARERICVQFGPVGVVSQRKLRTSLADGRPVSSRL